MCSDIYPKNIIMATLDKVPKDAHKVFEEHRRVAKEHWKVAEAKEFQEFPACFKKDRQGVVTQVKQVVTTTYQ
jgi:hypothetical protein